MTLKEWAWNIAIGADQFGSSACRGSTCLTVSARAATGRADGKARWIWLCNFLEFVNPGHIQRAIDDNRARLLEALHQLERAA